MTTVFQSIIETAEQQRPGYAASIGYSIGGTCNAEDLPSNLSAIFRFALGTPHDIANQTLMDFVPGYRLMIASEIPATRQQLQSFYGVDDTFNVESRTPFLTNYSHDYYLTADDDTGVFWLDHSGGTSLVSPNLDTFMRTTLRCYQQNAYMLEADGLLMADDELELEIALALNPQCEYWTD